MSKLIFMSPEHVASMNAVLVKDAASKAACAKLDRCWTMAYELAHGADTVWWTMSFDPAEGVSFSLDRPANPADVLYRAEYRPYLRWMQRLKAGEKDLPEPAVLSGHPDGLDIIGPAFQAAGKAATLDTEVKIP